MNRVKNIIYYGIIGLLAAFTLFSLLFIIVFVFIKGLPFINLEFLTGSPENMGKEGGIFPVIVGTVYVTVVAIIISAPIGVCAAMYFTEFSKGGKIVQLLRTLIGVLAGIPSIIFGLFGFAFFVIFLGLGWSILSGGLTLAMMILPTIIKSTEESLLAVPTSYREGALALGASRWKATYQIVLPCAKNGIVSGVILGVGRAVSETAALFLTVGGALSMPLSPFDSARTMSLHIYTLISEGISEEKAYATAALLIIIIIAINGITHLISKAKPLKGIKKRKIFPMFKPIPIKQRKAVS
jgi:phosphate transport system permease protein